MYRAVQCHVPVVMDYITKWSVAFIVLNQGTTSSSERLQGAVCCLKAPGVIQL